MKCHSLLLFEPFKLLTAAQAHIYLFFFLRTVIETKEPELFRECVLMELFVRESFMTNLILAAGEMGPSSTICSAASLDVGLMLQQQPACNTTPLKAGCSRRQRGKGLVHKYFPPDKNCCCGLRRKEKSHPFVLPGNSNALRFSVTQDLLKW